MKQEGYEDSRVILSPLDFYHFIVTVYLLLSVHLLFLFLADTFHNSLVQISQDSYLFVLVTITPFIVCLVLDQSMSPLPGWE